MVVMVVCTLSREVRIVSYVKVLMLFLYWCALIGVFFVFIVGVVGVVGICWLLRYLLGNRIARSDDGGEWNSLLRCLVLFVWLMVVMNLGLSM